MKILVTGGGGFIGLNLVKRLVQEGHNVVSLSRNFYREHREMGVQSIIGDICDQESVNNACREADIVYHVAAKAGVWGSFIEFEKVNVEGTRNVINACKTNKVSRLIYVSSASVVFGGDRVEGADETLPFPARPASNYTATKAEGEKLVLAANGNGLKTIALRPHLVWGPGDTQLIPGILKRARSNRMKRPGKGECLVDTTYIDNFTDALLLVLELRVENHVAWGKPYFITNGEPVPLWTFINGIIEAGGLHPVKKSVPLSVAYSAAWIMEQSNRLFKAKTEPFLTRFVIKELSTSHWFDISAAKRDLGYSPRIGFRKGMDILTESFKAAREQL